MTQSRLGSGADERVLAIDVLRGVALFGVMAVNLVNEFRVSIFAQFLTGAATATGLDRLANIFVDVALSSKALSLFSFLFGVSLAILFGRLSARGRPFYWVSRRLAVLLAFGLAHLFFIWNGDILTQYAIAGFLVLPLLAAPARVIALVAAAMLLLYAVLPFPPFPSLWSPASLEGYVTEATRVYASGSYGDIWRFSLGELPLIASLHVYVFPRTVALFLLGIAAWRSGFFDGTVESRRRLTWIAMLGCAIGGTLTVAEYAGVDLTLKALGPLGRIASAMAPVILALGYGAAVVGYVQSRAGRTVLAAFAPAGRMAFTNYILQSVIFAFVFFGYGLGYFGQLRAFPTLLFGIAVFALQCGLSALWLRYYRYGPLEWLWRRLMYGRPLPLIRASAHRP